MDRMAPITYEHMQNDFLMYALGWLFTCSTTLLHQSNSGWEQQALQPVCAFMSQSLLLYLQTHHYASKNLQWGISHKWNEMKTEKS